MKKIISIIVFLSITFSTFCFDYNKDNFSVGLDMETGLFVYKDKIYILGWDGKLWSDKRPEKIVNEFLDALMQRMVNNRGELTVILTGYKNETDAFLSANPGISARIANYIEFEDFTPDELCQIIIQYTKSFNLSPEVKKVIKDYISSIWPIRGKYFQNALFLTAIACEISRHHQGTGFRFVKGFVSGIVVDAASKIVSVIELMFSTGEMLGLY